ncbi:uroporphyrinogen-III C-methyltransferase [uncultured Draconibacterium sp.]|uniref:uroporphyrinogen-III C-methyltransferase n=1 Tax=uncultured Draconibacterium sp. TaxID=1573823 RepID=UPI0025FF9A57|nr:uroporphyrinogen-III C-methyltransferase [uncultured Draconibacterium sp.]
MGLSHLISIVGAGPGDPELLTMKAMKRLSSADLVLYDALLGAAILDCAKPGTELVYVGKLYKDGQDQTARQNEIHQQFLKAARQGKRVVRLKAGDPFIFGRGSEEARFCKEAGLCYEVVPGVTAALAGAARFEVPVTERGKNALALFSTGHRVNGSFSDIEAVVAVLQTGSPVMVYMGLNNLVELAETLVTRGISVQTPVQLMSRIGQIDECFFSTNLGETAVFLQENSPPMPTVIVIGKHTNPVA